jgi:PAS domain-containing protein
LPHLELSLSEPNLLRPTPPGPFDGDPLTRWAVATLGSFEPCVLIDNAGVVVAASRASSQLLAVDPFEAVGRGLVGEALHLLDFNRVSGELPEWELEKIPPLLALTNGGLARGLLRVRGADGHPATVDAISTPIRDAEARVIGSLTFFAPVGR